MMNKSKNTQSENNSSNDSSNDSNVLTKLFNVIETLVDSRRTRKSSAKSTVKSDVFQYPDSKGEQWYKYQQYTADHRFDCSGMRKLSEDNALLLIAKGLANTMVIDDQRVGRSLSDSAFESKYTNVDGVIVNVESALRKNQRGVVDVNKVKASFGKLSESDKKAIISEQLATMGLSMADLASK